MASEHSSVAHEALARTALVGGDAAAMAVHAMQVRACLQAIEDPEERGIVVAGPASLEADSRRR